MGTDPTKHMAPMETGGGCCAYTLVDETVLDMEKHLFLVTDDGGCDLPAKLNEKTWVGLYDIQLGTHVLLLQMTWRRALEFVDDMVNSGDALKYFMSFKGSQYDTFEEESPRGDRSCIFE